MKLKVLVNPDPFTTELSVLIHGHFALNIVIRLKNSKRTVIRITSCTLKKGENKIKISNLQRYVPGAYELEIKLLNGDVVETVALLKK